jgi:serine/threonine-protein kinase
MSEPQVPDPTVDDAVAPDPLDAGLAAAFGPDSGPPIPAGASVLHALGTSLPRVHLRQPPEEPESPVSRPDSPEMPGQTGPLHPSGRYQFVGEIARGGMGAVLKGRDTDLGRDVAVKVLLETHAGKTELVQRFVEEAQVAGQLQHPGITPVYDLGRFPDKRPYFTMKLVKGRTLAALLAGRKDPAEELPKYLGMLEQVCQTLAYAHARGVIHRDLKPSNVMVGAFGEVQVMDWGLAKVLRAGGGDDEPDAQQPPQTVSVIRTVRGAGAGSAGAPTQAGSVLGTPAYMAPEQARGDVELVDERADVFGLGALLCEILTGQPPFPGRSDDAMRRAQQAQLDDALAWLDGCGADAELVGLARRCLAARPEDRPRDARAVTAELTSYLNSVAARLRQAELARAEARAKAAEERKRRKLTGALAAAVSLLVLAGSGGALWVQHDRAQRAAAAASKQAEVDRKASAALQEALLFQQQGQWESARASLERAEGVLTAGGSDELRQRAAQLRADLDMLARLEAVRRRQAETATDNRPRRAWHITLTRAGVAPQYAEAFRTHGIDVLSLGEAEAADRIAHSSIRAALVAALDDWRQTTTDEVEKQRLLRIAGTVDPEPEGLAAQVRRVLAQGDRDKLLQLAAEAVAHVDRLSPAALGQLAVSLPPEESVRLLRAGLQEYPGDYWLNLDLALRLKGLDPPQRGEAIRFLSVCLALRPREFVVWNNLGILLLHENRLGEAEIAFRKATGLEPNSADCWCNLGLALSLQEKPDEAIEAFWAALARQPGHTLAEGHLFQALKKEDRLDKTVARLRRTIATQPDAPPVDRSYARYLLGQALAAQQKPVEAAEAYRQAIQLYPEAYLAYYHLGLALTRQGKHPDAVAALQKARELGPDDPNTLGAVGAALANLGEWSAAAAVCRQALEARDGLDADTHVNLSVCLMQMDQPDLAGAEKHLVRALELKPDSALACQNLGVIRMRQERWPEAEALLRKSIRLDDRYANFHCDLGIVLRRQSKSGEAIAPLRRAVDLEPAFADAHHVLGLALLDVADFAAAQLSLQRALELLPPGDRRRADFLQAVRRSEQLIALLCVRKQLHASAAGFFRDAFAAEPRLAEDVEVGRRCSAACSAARAGCGRCADAFLLNAEDRSRWCRQALDWLRADLAPHEKRLGSGKPEDVLAVRDRLQEWQRVEDLAGLREPDALAKLPADEQEACRKLWADVAAVLQKAQEKLK